MSEIEFDEHTALRHSRIGIGLLLLVILLFAMMARHTGAARADRIQLANRALTHANMLAKATVADEAEGVRRLLAMLTERDPTIVSAAVVTEGVSGKYSFLRSLRYVASTDRDLQGRVLSGKDPVDKELADRVSELQKRLGQRDTRGAAVLWRVLADDVLEVRLPVIDGDEFLGLVNLRSQLPAQGTAIPVWWFFVIVLAAGVLYFGSERTGKTGRLVGGALAAFGATAVSALAIKAGIEAPPLGTTIPELYGTVLGAVGSSLSVADLPAEPFSPGHAIPGLVWWGISLGVLTGGIQLLAGTGKMARALGVLRRDKFAYIYIAPAILAMVVVVFVPFAIGFSMGFQRHSYGEWTFVGLDNFIDILASDDYSITDPLNFYFTLFITVLWTASNVFLHLCIGLMLAMILKNPLLKLKGVYRVLLIVPWAVPNYITALTWRGMFDPEFGAINAMLGIQGFSWWNSTATAFSANLMTNVWLGFPFMMVVSLGALQSIPGDLYEAADVDGASRWQQFRLITMPLLKPALVPAVILGVIWTFNMFNIIYLVSGGAPAGGTDILIVEAYRWAFERGEKYGYAAAYSILILIILVAYSLITNRITRATEGAYND